jgi:hypothetical protein
VLYFVIAVRPGAPVPALNSRVLDGIPDAIGIVFAGKVVVGDGPTFEICIAREI